MASSWYLWSFIDLAFLVFHPLRLLHLLSHLLSGNHHCMGLIPPYSKLLSCNQFPREQWKPVRSWSPSIDLNYYSFVINWVGNTSLSTKKKKNGSVRMAYLEAGSLLFFFFFFLISCYINYILKNLYWNIMINVVIAMF